MLSCPGNGILCRHRIMHPAKERLPVQEGVSQARKLPDHTPEAEIIHRRRPKVSLQVLRLVAPFLRNDHGIRVLLPDRGAQLLPALVRHLDASVPCKNIRHVKAPAVDAIRRLQPFAQDRMFFPPDLVPKLHARIVQGRERIDAQPALQAAVLLPEIVGPPFLHPFMLDAGMVDGDVQDDLHPRIVHRAAQALQGLVSAEMRVHMLIIDTVVLMVGIRRKNRIQIQHRDPEILKIREFLPDAVQVPAEKVQGLCFVIGIGNVVPVPVHRLISPVFEFPVLHVVGRIPVRKALRKDLVHDRAVRPGGLPEVGPQAEIVGMVGNIGGHAVLRIEIHRILCRKTEVITEPVFGDRNPGRIINKPVLFLCRKGLVISFEAVGEGHHHDMFHRRLFQEADTDLHRIPDAGRGIGDECLCAVTVDAVKPVKHTISPSE